MPREEPSPSPSATTSSQAWSERAAQIDGVMLADHHRLKRWLQKIKKTKKNQQQQLQKWQQSLQEAIEQKDWRASQQHRPEFDTTLPICEHRREIADAIRDHQVIIVCGETGSGKSTQLPLVALQAGFAVNGIIGHTQPRRIAARSIAARIASHLKSSVGDQVGFKIRFQDKTNPRTHIKLMTDGILLAETQTDRFLNQYSLIIVDEAHERSLNIDFLLGNLKRILDRRSELRLIITSATIDTERFAEHFSDSNRRPAPVFNIEGRTYPVEIHYRADPQQNSNELADSNDWLIDQTLETLQSESGDVLVFLPTEQDIRMTHKKLRGAIAQNLANQQVDVLPLYARLSTEHQNAIFNPAKNRRIVLATNVAESSVTVPRISCVIDTGTARISRYSPRNKVQRLPIEPVSQASANQRAGRCGRIGPGTCLRLFTKEDFESRPAYTTPEIRRTNLASVILQAKVLNLGPIESFPFLDPPRNDSIRDGYRTLQEINAIDSHHELTSIGRRIGRLPVDPRIGRMILAADSNRCLSEVLIIVSALEIQDPRQRPAEHQKLADEQHQKFADERSDFFSLLKIWDFYQKLRHELSRSKLQKACRQNFLSYSLLRQWQQLHYQLKTLANDSGLKTHPRTDDYDSIHKSLLTGLLSGIGMLTDKFEYTGASGVKFRLWPGSNVFAAKPPWVITAEIVETGHRYGRTVAKINPVWIEPIAQHLTKSNFTQPHWSSKRETVLAHEKVSLFGLPIVAARRTPYGRIDPVQAREIFIEQGLAEDQIRTEIKFLRHNRDVLDQAKLLVAKTRNRDFVVDPYQVIAFYEQVIPENAFDVVSLLRQLKSDPDLDQQLRFQLGQFLPELDAPPDTMDNPANTDDVCRQFPDQIELKRLQLPVEYRYAPGDAADGATIQIPKLALGQLDDAATPWLIPGFLETRILSLIRSLPKSIRRNLVPAPDTAKRVAAQVQSQSGEFHAVVARLLSAIGQLDIDPSMFRQAKVDDFLKPNIRVADERGEIIDQSRSVAELRERLNVNRESMVEATQLDPATNWQGVGFRSWDWEQIPESINIIRGSLTVPAFPGICDEGDCVSQRVFDNVNAAEQATTRGMVRLFQIVNRKNIKSQVNWLPDFDRIALLAGGLGSTSELKQQLGDLISRVAFVENAPCCRIKSEFEQRQAESAERIARATAKIAKWLPEFAQNYHASILAMNELAAKYDATRTDIRDQIDAITEKHFLVETPWQWLQHLPRYFAAILSRIEKRPSVAEAKENSNLNVIQSLWKKYDEQKAAQRRQGTVDSELETFRWMIEELRVSLFAQQLGTSLTVSEKRLEKQWQKVHIAI